MRKPIKRIPKPKPVSLNCEFCHDKTQPDYKEPDKLAVYTTERGRLLAASQTGLCAKHQRQLAMAVKRARHLALLPFTVHAG